MKHGRRARGRVRRAVRRQRLSVRIAAVTDSKDVNQAFAVGNTVHHPPLANTNAPKVSCTLQLHNARWTRIRHQRLDLSEEAPGNLGIKVLQLFAR